MVGRNPNQHSERGRPCPDDAGKRDEGQRAEIDAPRSKQVGQAPHRWLGYSARQIQPGNEPSYSAQLSLVRKKSPSFETAGVTYASLS
jgi:hypothetical protein